MTIKSMTVFCGASPGKNPIFMQNAKDFGQLLANRGIQLVYGGGRIGMMGAVADSCLEAGGKVIGIIPKHLAAKEVAHNGLTELHVVDDMHHRKKMMADLADAFVTLPGGLGSFEEAFEAITWSQLGIHKKVMGFLNVDHYYDPVIDLIQHGVEQGFIREEHKKIVVHSDQPEDLLEKISLQEIPNMDQWLLPAQF